MKKILVLAVCILGFVTASAQVSFKPGLRGGVNFSHFTQSDSQFLDSKSKTDFYLGGFGALKLSKFYTLQPEIDYSRQGSKIENTSTNNPSTDTYNVSYLSFAVVNKFTFNNFNFHVGPTLDFLVEKDKKIDTFADFDFAFLLGAGYNFTDNFGIEARVKKGILPVLEYSNGDDQTNVVFSIGATYTFDVK